MTDSENESQENVSIKDKKKYIKNEKKIMTDNKNESQENVSIKNQEEYTILVGYKDSTRRYLLQGSVLCATLSLILLFVFGQLLFIPLLATAASLMAEMWYRSRKLLVLKQGNLWYGEEKLSWNDILRYTTWDSFKIPFTPWKWEGVTIYHKTQQFCIYSHVENYDVFLNKLNSLSAHTTPTPLWYQYSPRLVRVIRYVLAFLFSFLFFLILSLSYLIIIAIAVLGFFIVRSFIRSKKNRTQNIPEDAWIAGFIGLVLFCILYYIFQSPTIIFAISIVPLGCLLWLPWQPKRIAIIEESLFLGKHSAYPLRHLRTSHMISRWLIFKIWHLSFANGDVWILPCIENFNILKIKLEREWMDIQKRYQGKKMTNEEAEIRTPQEEAHRIHFFESDKISFSYPLNWYFLLPFFFIMHWAILGTCAWCIFATPIGRISILGLFLREIFPILCLVYVGYILFSLLPKIIRLFRYESMDDQGLILRGNLLPWEDIQLIVPYTDVHKKERIAIYDNKGKQLLELRQEMSDFPYIWNKIKEKVKKTQIADSVESGAANLLTQRSIAWTKSYRFIMALIILIWLPFIVNSIVEQKEELYGPSFQAVTLPHKSANFLSRFISVIPYQDYQGKTWYALACPQDPDKSIEYKNVAVKYIPDNPIYVMPYGDLVDPFIPLVNYWENKGFSIEHFIWIENLIHNAKYVFWCLSGLLIIFALLHKNLFAGLLLQKMPALLGPSLYMPAALILQKTMQLLLHIILFIALLFTIFFLRYGQSWFVIPIPSITLFLSILLPIFMMPYLAYILLDILPNWLRSFKRWELKEDSIQYRKTTIYWNQIQSISVVDMPSTSPFSNKNQRKIAWIQATNKDKIILEGELIHFPLLVNHIRKVSKCKTEDVKGIKRLYRKAYSLPKLAHAILCLLIIGLIGLFYLDIYQKKEDTFTKGKIETAKISYNFFKKIAIISYKDDINNQLYDLAWQHTKDTTQIPILYNADAPYFWESFHPSISSVRELLYINLQPLFLFIEKYQTYIDLFLLYGLGILSITLCLACLRHIFGIFTGI